MSIDTDTKLLQRAIPRSLRGHVFLAAFVALALLGGGLRFIPTSAAAPAGSTAGAASTACNAA